MGFIDQVKKRFREREVSAANLYAAVILATAAGRPISVKDEALFDGALVELGKSPHDVEADVAAALEVHQLSTVASQADARQKAAGEAFQAKSKFSDDAISQYNKLLAEVKRLEGEHGRLDGLWRESNAAQTRIDNLKLLHASVYDPTRVVTPAEEVMPQHTSNIITPALERTPTSAGVARSEAIERERSALNRRRFPVTILGPENVE